MRSLVTTTLVSLSMIALGASTIAVAAPPLGEGWEPLFNGKDLSGWKIPEGDNGHWKVVDGVIDYDAQSEAKGDRVTVELNGKIVIDRAHLPGLPRTGPIGLQHHGGLNKKTGRFSPASSLIQFRNIYVKKL